MGQISGSIALDMTKVQREITSAVGETVAKLIMPALAQISAQVADLAGAEPLGKEDMVATLAHHLLVSETLKPIVVQGIAEHLAARLIEQGYALVPVAGPALEHAKRVAPLVLPNVNLGPEVSARIAAEELDRHRVGHAGQGRPIQLDGDALEAEARADARLAQARRDGIEDSWFEPED